MSASRRGMDAFALQLMVLLCSLWGMQQVAIKLAAPDMSPLLQVALRSAIAALLVGMFMLCRRQPFSPGDGTWRAGALVAVLFTLEFMSAAEALRYASASHVVVLLYTAPIFSALGLHLLSPGERLRRLQWGGILLAFAGILLAFGAGALRQRLSVQVLLGDLWALLAGLCWGMTTVAVRCSRLAEASASKTLLYQLAGSAVLLLPLAWLTGQAAGASFTAPVWGSLLFQGVLVSFASYLAWFWLLRRYLAAQIGVCSFLTPLFGVAFGVLLLDERLDVFFVAGGLLVLLGISLVSADGWWRRVLGTSASARGQVREGC